MNLPTFISKVKQINPEGNISNAYQMLTSTVEIGEVDDNGNLVTYEYVINKFAAYIKSWNMKFAKKLASGYLAKADSMKNIEDFVLNSMYKQDYQSGVTNIDRDLYLFGDNVDELIKRFENAEQIIEREKNKFL